MPHVLRNVKHFYALDTHRMCGYVPHMSTSKVSNIRLDAELVPLVAEETRIASEAVGVKVSQNAMVNALVRDGLAFRAAKRRKAGAR